LRASLGLRPPAGTAVLQRITVRRHPESPAVALALGLEQFLATVPRASPTRAVLSAVRTKAEGPGRSGPSACAPVRR